MSSELFKIVSGLAGLMLLEKSFEHLDRTMNSRQANALEEGQKKSGKITGTTLLWRNNREFSSETCGANTIRHKPVQGISNQMSGLYKNLGKRW